MNYFYVAQTFVEDSRMDVSDFCDRIIHPLSRIKQISSLYILLHPRSCRDLYEKLSLCYPISFSFYGDTEISFADVFIGHYSTLLFKLILSRHKVLLLDPIWDPIPQAAIESSSWYIKYRDPSLCDVDVNNLMFSEPSPEFNSIFIDQISSNVSNLSSILNL
jgi:hypothetical protein